MFFLFITKYECILLYINDLKFSTYPEWIQFLPTGIANRKIFGYIVFIKPIFRYIDYRAYLEDFRNEKKKSIRHLIS